MRWGAAVIGSCAAALLGPAPASALSVTMVELVDTSGGGFALDSGAYSGLVADLSGLVVPISSDGGGTLGSLGIEAGVGFGLSVVKADSRAWRRGTRGASDLQGVLDITARKGLPWSLELGGHLSHLTGSSVWGMGLELEAAPLNGLARAPDLSLAFSASTAIGTGPLQLTVLGARLTLSKAFALGASGRIEPAVGYQLLAALARVHTLGVLDEDGNLTRFEIPDRGAQAHRGFLAVRVRFGPVLAALQGATTGRVQRVGLQVGLAW